MALTKTELNMFHMSSYEVFGVSVEHATVLQTHNAHEYNAAKVSKANRIEF